MSEAAPAVDPPHPNQSKPRGKRRVNYALAGTLLASGMHYDQIAPKVGSSSGESLRTALHRKGVTMRQIRNIEPQNERRLTVTASLASEASDMIRDTLNGDLLDQAKTLGTRKPTFKSLHSRGQGRAATLKQLAETWRTLNGNPDSVTISFGATSLSDAVPVKPEPLPVVDCVSEQSVNQPVTPPPVQGVEQT